MCRPLSLFLIVVYCMVMGTATPMAQAITSPNSNGVNKAPGFLIVAPWTEGNTFRNNADYGPSDTLPCPPSLDNKSCYHKNYLSGAQDYHALDLNMYLEPVYPIAPGQVVYAGPTNSGYGTVVFVDHQNGYKSLYAHLNGTNVQANDYVDTATQIGTSGTSGTTAYHLHVALYKDAPDNLVRLSATHQPYGGVSVVPEPFASCTKNANAHICDDLVYRDMLYKERAAPATITDEHGRVYVFARGIDDAQGHNVLWYKVQECDVKWPHNLWTAIQPPQQNWTWTHSPVVAKDGQGRINVFMRGNDGHLYHTQQTNADRHVWSDWTDLGGAIPDQMLIGIPAVTLNIRDRITVNNLQVGRLEVGRLEVFWRGGNGELYHIWQESDTNWTSIQSLGGKLISDPIVGQNGQGDPDVGVNGYGRPKVFVQQSANNNDSQYWLWSIQPQANGNWQPGNFVIVHTGIQGTGIIGRSALRRNDNGRLEVFVRDSSGPLLQIVPSVPGETDTFLRNFDPAFSNPVVGQSAAGLQMFARGAESQLQLIEQTDPVADVWQDDWRNLGLRLTSDLALVRAADNRLKLFAWQDDELAYIAQDPQTLSLWPLMSLGKPGDPQTFIGEQPGGVCPRPTAGNVDTQNFTWVPVSGAATQELVIRPIGAITPVTIALPAEQSSLARTAINPGLQVGIQYLWKIIARYATGAAAESDIWSFTPSLYPYGIRTVTTDPDSMGTRGTKNLPLLFDGITAHPNYGLINFTPGPLTVTLTFQRPVTLTGFTTAIGGQTGFPQGYRWSVQADVDGSGVYQTIVPAQYSDAEIVNIPFAAPVTASAFRIIHERFTGDGVEHIREITPIFAPGAGSSAIAGQVATGTDASHLPLDAALVQVCAVGGVCQITATNSAGRYMVAGLDPGQYRVTVFPPNGSLVLPAILDSITVDAGTLDGQDLFLARPTPPPAGTTITSRSTSADGIPVVSWAEPFTLTTNGCPAGGASYQILQEGSVIPSASMVNGSNGTYTASIAPLTPTHGNAKIQIICTGATFPSVTFDIYIDPSGVVKTVAGEPIAGATVTLYRADGKDGPFTLVPNGSALMSPMNRANPDTTDAAGHFGWDVLAGFYKVLASKVGCTAPNNPNQAYVVSAVLTIPPPVIDLDLRLRCSTPTPTATPTSTSTPTSTPTPTATPTNTPTPTSTSTPTSTPTPTATPTSTPTPPPTPPTMIVGAGGQCAGPNTPTSTLNLVVGGGQGGINGLTLSGSSSNTALVPNGNITFGGSGANRTATIAATTTSGTALITITVSDGQLTAQLPLTVKEGTLSNNTINGTSGPDIIFGQGGNDTLNGLAGNDLLCGGSGEDALAGGDSDDTLDGESGNDTLAGNDGNDILRGDSGEDRLEGGNGDDTLDGASGNDTLDGASGNDTLTGGASGDFFSGGLGTDTAIDFKLIEGDTQDGTIP